MTTKLVGGTAPDGSQYTTATDGNGTVLTGSAVTNSGTFAVQATQAGTWTVQIGNTPNTTAIKVDGSAVTQPVSMTNATTTFRLLSAAGTSGDANNVKASAGVLYGIQGANVSTSARYLKIYNTAGTPTAGSGTPIKTLYLPASSAFTFDFFRGYTFATGIGITIVTTGADNGNTSVTAGDIVALNLDYA